MIFSRKYSRNFISLNQESSAFNYDFRDCMGKCIIEIKNGQGKITVYAQGLKPETFYKVCLISLKGNNLSEHFLGFIDIDDSGKGYSKWFFNPDSVNDDNIQIEDFNIITFIVENEEDIVTPLVGYLNNKISWKDKYISNKVVSSFSNYFGENNNMSNNNNGLNEYERGKVDEIKGKIDEAQGQIDYKKGKIDEAQGQIDYKKGKLDELKGDLDYQRGKLDELKGDLDYQRGKLDELKGKIDYAVGKREEEFWKNNNMVNTPNNSMNNNDMNNNMNNNMDNNSMNNTSNSESNGQNESSLNGSSNENINNTPNSSGNNNSNNGMNSTNSSNNMNNNSGESGCFPINTESLKETYKFNNSCIDFDNLINKFKKDMINLEKMTSNEYKNKLNDCENNDIEYIKVKNPRMYPFENTNENIKWYRITPNELTVLSDNMWKYINNQFVFSCFKKYKHLMLGINNNNNQESYILAVPCKANSNFIAKGELAGFNSFIPIDKNEESEYGYRLFYIV